MLYDNVVRLIMTTIELLDKLIEITSKRPDVISGFDWQDTQLMIELEIDNRQSLYPDEQYNLLIDRIRNQFNILRSESAKNSCNSDTVCSCLILLKGMILSLPDLDYTSSFIQRAAFDHEKLTHYTDDTAIIIGDSHVNFFSGNESLTFKAIADGINVCPNTTDFKFTCLHLGPCLAYNCMNESSKYNFYKKYNYLCDSFIKPGSKVCICLGEIDLRAHVFKQAGEQSRPWKEICDDIITNYMALLEDVKQRKFKTYCWGPIASMPDNTSEEDELKTLAAEGLFDQELISVGNEIQRNEATAYFNKRLEEECAQKEIIFMSIFDQMVDDNMKTIGSFLSSDRCHLSSAILPIAAKIWSENGF